MTNPQGVPLKPARRVLFVAYHYPPMRSPGVERSAKYARYLPEFGVLPQVLTTGAFGGDGEALRAWDPLGPYRRWFNPAARHDAAAATRTRTTGSLATWLRRLRGWLLVPDGQVTWLPAAAWCALGHLRRHGADLVYTTSPPVSAHLLGRFLRDQTGLPWVADLRDAWLYDPLDPALLRASWRRQVEARLEASVLARADAVVTATQITAADLRARYPAHAAKVRVIPNGFDPDDAPDRDTRDEGAAAEKEHRTVIPEAPADPADRPLRLVHTGSFSYSHPRRSPQDLLRALRRLYDLEPVWRERLELVLVGELSPVEQADARGVARLEGPVDRARALAFQRRADVLLLVDHPRPWPASNAPGKLYEYLATGKPLLALCGAGEVETTVTRLGAGLCAPPDDVDAIEAVLREVWRRHVAGDLPRVTSGLEGYHRRALAGRLAACFEEVWRP